MMDAYRSPDSSRGWESARGEVSMEVRVYIPTPYRRLTQNQTFVEGRGDNVVELLDDLETRFPGIRGHVFDEVGEIHRHVNVYVNNVAAEELGGKQAVLKGGDEVALIPAMGGGAVPFNEEQIRRYSRHIIHHVDDVGRPKVQSAVESIAQINPDVKVEPFQTVLSSDNAKEIISQYDLVVNGCDNFPTRYLVNDCCVFLKKPLVDGSIFKFEGQVTVFAPGQGCYRCLYPAPPPPGLVPSCQEAGVLGVLCGIIGSLQAIEATKLLLGIGDS